MKTTMLELCFFLLLRIVAVAVGFYLFNSLLTEIPKNDVFMLYCFSASIMQIITMLGDYCLGIGQKGK